MELVEIRYWIEDHTLSAGLLGALSFIIILALLMILAPLLMGGPGIGVVNASSPTPGGMVIVSPGHPTDEASFNQMMNITPTPTATPTPTPTPRPEYTNNMTYEQWVVWVTQYYYNCSIPEPQGHLDPLSREAYELWKKNESERVAVIPRPDDSEPFGSRVYDPSATPTPTPVPTPPPDPYANESHSTLRDSDRGMIPPPDHTGMTAGILAYDPEHSHGIYQYYYKGDVTAIQLRFVVNQYTRNITSEHVVFSIKKQVLGQYITVIQDEADYNYFIPAVYVDQYEGKKDVLHIPGFTTDVLSFTIPSQVPFGGAKLDTRGQYIIEVVVYADGVEACRMSQDIAIL